MIYEVDAKSPYQVFRAGCDLAETFRAVKVDGSGILPAEFGDTACGILMSKLARQGEDAYILTNGGARLELGESVNAGDLLTCGDGGLGFKCCWNDFIFARALQGGAAGEVIQVLIVNAGFISILDDDDPETWNTVKIFFGFPISKHRRVRGISLPNPKDDLTREEIKEAGQYAVDNQLILNTAGEIANRVLGAALKRREVEIIRLD